MRHPWAYRFVILEVSHSVGRHFWRRPDVPLDAEDWDKLPGRFGFEPDRESEWRDLLAALRRAVDTELSPRQREAFVGLVLNGVPLDALAVRLGSRRCEARHSSESFPAGDVPVEQPGPSGQTDASSPRHRGGGLTHLMSACATSAPDGGG